MSSGERLDNGVLITGRLAVVRKICGALADDLRNYGGDEWRASGVLTSLIIAIEQGQLESLHKAMTPWARAEVARQDALKQEEIEALPPDLTKEGW